MICDLEQVEALVYGELSGDAKADAARHVAACAACSREQSLLHAERAIFTTSRDASPLPDLAVVLTASREAPRRPRARRGLAFSAVAAAAAVFLLVGVFARRPTMESAPPAEGSPLLACYEGQETSAETAPYSLYDAIAGVERDYAACLQGMPSSPALVRGDPALPGVTPALFTPLPLEACQ